MFNSQLSDQPHIILNNIIANRRSVKPLQFVAGERVPDSIIRQGILNATWAPTHSRNEPWYFKVFTEEGLKTLAKFQSELYKAESGDKFNEGKFKKLLTDPTLCSHVIAICMRRVPDARIPVMEDIEAVACAVQNLALTISAYGYGGYWSSGGITYMPSAKSFFGLSASDELLGFYSVGKIAIASNMVSRRPIEDISDWITE